MKALVHTESGTVTDIVADNATFDVHSDYVWKDMISDYVEGTDEPPDYSYDKTEDTITRKAPPTETYDVKRRWAYNPVVEQLDQLWHDIDDGKLGEDAKTGVWYNGVKSTKDAYPKG